MIKKQDLPDCPIAITLQLIGSKWKIFIIQKLEERPWRFNELFKELNGISRRVLSENLRSMEKDGIVERQKSLMAPYHVEYKLSKLGESFLPLLKQMAAWGNYYRNHAPH